MNNKDFCEKLNISEPTLYNWKKEKPFLYTIIMNYKNQILDKKEILSQQEILLKYFNNLSELEQEYYISEIKTRVLKKAINK